MATTLLLQQILIMGFGAILMLVLILFAARYHMIRVRLHGVAGELQTTVRNLSVAVESAAQHTNRSSVRHERTCGAGTATVATLNDRTAGQRLLNAMPPEFEVSAVESESEIHLYSHRAREIFDLLEVNNEVTRAGPIYNRMYSLAGKDIFVIHT